MHSLKALTSLTLLTLMMTLGMVELQRANAQVVIVQQGGEIFDTWTSFGGTITQETAKTGLHSIRIGRGNPSNNLSDPATDAISIELVPINTTGFTNISVRISHSVRCPGVGEGMDTREGVVFNVSLDGGPWQIIDSVQGFSNHCYGWTTTTGGVGGSWQATNPVQFSIPNGTNSVAVRIYTAKRTNPPFTTADSSQFDRGDEGVFLDDIELLAIVPAGPTVTLTSSPQPACPGQAITFTATAAGTGSFVNTPNFTFLDNGVSAQSGASNTFTWTPGTFAAGDSVRVLLSDGANPPNAFVASSAVVIPTIQPAAAVFNSDSGNVSFCGGDTLVYVIHGSLPQATGAIYRLYQGNTATALQRFADGDSLTFRLPIPNTAAAYSFTYRTTLGTCQSSGNDTLDLIVTPTPIVALNPPSASICPSGSVALNATVATGSLPTTTYVWELNGSPLPTVGPTHNATQAGQYVVRAVNGNCSTRDTAIVTQVAGPSFTLGPDTALCANGSYIEYGPAAPAGFTYSYAWSKNNAPIGGNTKNLTIIGAGTYILTVTQQPGGCIGADTINVAVGIPAQLDAPDTVYLCPGGTVSITASSTNPPGQTYAWSLPAPNTNLNTVTVSTLGQLSVVVTSADGCQATALIDVVTSPIQGATLGPDLVLCANSSLTLQLNLPGGQPMPAGTTYLWSTGATSPIISVNAPGNFSVTATLNGCAVVETLVVSPAGLPPAGFLGADTTACRTVLTVAINLDAPPLTGVVYTWFVNGAPTGFVGATYPAVFSGSYVAVATNGPCTISDTMVLTIDSLPPAFSLGGQRVLCAGQSITLSVPLGFTNYAWSRDGVLLGGSSNNQLAFSAPGLYAVTASHPCGTRTASVVIVAGGTLPTAQNVDTTFCVPEGELTGYTAIGPRGYASYEWSNGSTSRVLFIPANGDSVTETLTATDSCGGTLTVTHTIRFVPGGGLGPMPTAFTPNGDGFNETFGPMGAVLPENYVLLIFNRWGQLVFEADQPGEHWNGTFQNNGDEILQQGIYMYRVQVGTCGGGVDLRFGHVVLINGQQR